MLFNSLSFMIFFPIVTTLFFLLPQRARWVLLLGASCIFYMAFVPKYILILGFTIVIDYFAGILIESAVGARRRLYLLMSLAANIGILAVFKYYNFLNDNLTALAHFFKWNNPVPALTILLPIGLSFHTFQAMSYTIEVYRGSQKAERHFGIYALYVMFYPQLVAGPIERPQNLLAQFRTYHPFDYERVTRGLMLMAFGMFKKVVVADRLAVEVNRIYDDPHSFHGVPLLLATLFFSFQIYYDFSGYSDIALGSAEVMGFKLMKNFDTPYFSSSISEFWRRWHISLSTWFRDYVYLPLGGKRVPVPRWYLNLMIVFMVSGLWHGARWTFVVWGALHGGYLVFAEATRSIRDRLATWMGVRWPPPVSVLITFGLVMVAWVFFRAGSIGDAGYIIAHMFRGLPSDALNLSRGVYVGIDRRAIATCGLLIAGMLSVEWYDRQRGLFTAVRTLPVALRFGLYFSLVYGALLFGVSDQQFIYFQF